MKKKQPTPDTKLKEKIKILEAENQRLTERAEDIVLLSIISEHLLGMTDRQKIVEYVLEEISILKNIPFTALGTLKKDQKTTVDYQYTSLSEKNQVLTYLDFEKSTKAKLYEIGNIVKIDVSEIGEKEVKLNFKTSDFKPSHLLLASVRLFTLFDFFLFADDNPEANEKLDTFVPLLIQISNLASARFENLRLSEQLKKQNTWLVQEVNKRTNDLNEKLKYQTQIIETSQDGVIIHKDQIIQFANAAACSILEVDDSSQLIGRSVFDFISDVLEQKKIIRERIQQVSVKKQTAPFRKTHIITSKGNSRTVEISGIPFLSGEELMVHLTLHDVTKRNKMEKELAEERSLFMGGPTVVFKWMDGASWPVKYVSPNVFEQFGYHPEELLNGKISYDNIIHPDDRLRIDEEIRHFKTKGIYQYEQQYRLRLADGTYHQVMDFTIFHPDDEGNSYYHGYVIDISKQISAEKALHQSESRFRSMVEYSFEGIGLIDNKFTFTYANQNLCKIFAYPLEEIVGADFRKFLTPESLELVTGFYLRRQQGENIPARYEFTIVQKDGSVRNVEISSSVIMDENEKPLTIVQLIDNTEKKHAEAEIKQAHELLKQNYQSLKAVKDITEAVHLPADIEILAKRSIESLSHYAGTPSAGFFVLNKRENQLEFVAATGFPKALLTHIQKIPINISLAGLAVKEQKVITSSNFTTENRTRPFAIKPLSKAGYKATISIPLISQENVLGVINLLFKNSIHLTQSERDTFFAIGQTLGLALVNVNHLNALGKEIVQRKKIETELRKYREELELLVKERTEALEEANTNLQKKNKELTRYNDLFINREFRIKELRDEVKKLKQKLSFDG